MAEPSSKLSPHAAAAIDVGAGRAAAVYAKAFLGAAESSGQVESLLAEFDSLITEVLDAFPDLEKVLGSALVQAEDKEGLLDRVLGSQASPLVLNYLKVLARHGRLGNLRTIHRAIHQLYNQMQGRVPVYVYTAAPLPPELAQRLREQLRGMLGREPELVEEVKPDLIGGLVMRVGDTVYDGSVSAQLEALRGQMIHRSTNEIQSRRDRFRHSAGDSAV